MQASTSSPQVSHFYPRPPRGGRPSARALELIERNFYPRPPRGGRHWMPNITGPELEISIHALREEGDTPCHSEPTPKSDFYPRPPRGGRPENAALRQNGLMISIHALREEGDRQFEIRGIPVNKFLSTPSARRATTAPYNLSVRKAFLSTPSARRATSPRWFSEGDGCISIHALREEGDPRCFFVFAQSFVISIHALREEGDWRCTRKATQ